MRRRRAAGLLVVIVAIAVALAQQPPETSTAASPPVIHRSEEPDVVVLDDAPPREPARALGEADGAVPDGTSVFDDSVPGVANLDADLLDAVRRAAADAGRVRFVVDSGWRSPEYQEHLLDEAISEYGSMEEAARWVATPNTSAHVSGHAIDIGPSEASAWLSAHGAAYGLCQIYDNEPWHFELRPDAVSDGCPAKYADPTHDPRMQQ